MTVAAAVIDVLASWGVRTVFTCPGSTEAAFLDAMVDRSTPELMLTTHEGVTIAMADGYARATGQPSVAFVHANVGLTNTLSNLYAAQLSRSPVVILNGLKAQSVQSNDGFTTVRDTGGFTAPYVKSHRQSLMADSVPVDVNNALKVSTSEPMGPTWVGLSQDLMEAGWSKAIPDSRRFRVQGRVRPDPDAVAIAAELLSKSRHPAIVAGAEVVRHGAVLDVVRLAEKLGAVVFCEDRRAFERPAFPGRHPQYAGMYAGKRSSLKGCDVLFFVGCRCFMEFEASPDPHIQPSTTVIQSHVDPGEIGRMYGFDVGLVGDERLVIADLLAALPDGHRPVSPQPFLDNARSEWADMFVDSSDHRGALSVNAVAEIVAATVNETTTVVLDATTSTPQLLRQLPHDYPEQIVTSASGALGWGMGASLGVALGMPGRRVLAIGGDGVFQFGIQALWTASYYSIPVTFLVVNNQSYAAVGAALSRYGQRAVARTHFPCKDLSGIDIAITASGFGIRSHRVTTAPDLMDALKHYQTSGGPALVEIMTDPQDLGLATHPGAV